VWTTIKDKGLGTKFTYDIFAHTPEGEQQPDGEQQLDFRITVLFSNFKL